MKLSELIISYRKEHKLSQRQFAKQCGVSNGFISILEKDENPNTGLQITPSIENLRKIASGMSLSLQDMFQLVGDLNVSLDAELENMPADERQLLTSYRRLNDDGKTAARSMVAGLLATPEYTRGSGELELGAVAAE